ncbi:flavin monooxygenase-like, FAD/NAD(P)-binding domain protein, partial [Tanacetum coccineum]
MPSLTMKWLFSQLRAKLGDDACNVPDNGLAHNPKNPRSAGASHHPKNSTSTATSAHPKNSRSTATSPHPKNPTSGTRPKNPTSGPSRQCYSYYRWIAQALSRKVSLPSEEDMLSDVERYYKEMKEKGLAEDTTHQGLQADYMEWVFAQTGMAMEQYI